MTVIQYILYTNKMKILILILTFLPALCFSQHVDWDAVNIGVTTINRIYVGDKLVWDKGVADWPRDTETAVVDVTNPGTGRIWMDRNLGASRVAISSADVDAYGDLYQWGRAADEHQIRTSGINSTLSSSDTPGHGEFITAGIPPYDWRSPQNDNLWQGVDGINNPCPSGYRLPTEAELEAERTSWSSNNAAGAFDSPLKLPVGGFRLYSTGVLINVGSSGNYWSSTVDGTYSRRLSFSSTGANMDGNGRALGFSVRCFKYSETPTGYDLDLNVHPPGAGVLTGAGHYSDGYVVSISATAKTGWEFVEWTGDIAHVDDPMAASTTVTMPASNITLTANFEEEDVEAAVVEVTNPETGKTWMDRNLGARRAATSSTDTEAYGYLYQWGRATDGHQKRTSGSSSTLSTNDSPGHKKFILAPNSPYDWRSPQNDNLWQGVAGTNNPCPSGYRLPTVAELEAERTSWSSNNAAGAFGSPLKLPVGGFRLYSTGVLINVGSSGNYWSSTVGGTYSSRLYFNSTVANIENNGRAMGFSVRCLKE